MTHDRPASGSTLTPDDGARGPEAAGAPGALGLARAGVASVGVSFGMARYGGMLLAGASTTRSCSPWASWLAGAGGGLVFPPFSDAVEALAGVAAVVFTVAAGLLLGPLFAGPLADRLGLDAVFLLAAGVGALAGLLAPREALLAAPSPQARPLTRR